MMLPMIVVTVGPVNSVKMLTAFPESSDECFVVVTEKRGSLQIREKVKVSDFELNVQVPIPN